MEPGHAGDDGAGASERALQLLVAGLCAAVAAAPIADNSLLTHIATGRIQADSGLPRSNPFLVSSTDFPVPSWWWSGAIGWLERWWGLGAARVMFVLVAAALGAVVVRLCRPQGAEDRAPSAALVQAVPAAVCVALLVPFLNGRPHLAGFLLLAVALLIWRERLSPWWLVAVFAVWVNVHGSWLYGVAVLGILWVAEALDDREWHFERARAAVAALLGLLVGGVVYPERFRLVLLPTEQFGSDAAREAMRAYREWAPAGMSSPLTWILAVSVVLAVFGVYRSRRPGSAVAVVVLAAMGFSALRLLPVAAISLAGFSAVGVASVSSLGRLRQGVRVALGVLGGALVVLSVVGALTAPHVDLGRFPVEELDWLEDRDLVGREDTLVVTNDWIANYVEFERGADARMWVDDRPSVETLNDYVRMRRLEPGWEETVETVDPDVVLWQRSDRFPGRLAEQPGWEVALTTDRFVVLCRSSLAERCA